MAKSKLIQANKEIEKRVVGGYKKIEDGVVSAYKKVESSVVGAYGKVEDKFVDSFLTEDGESVEDAKNRMAAGQRAREESSRAEMDERAARQKAGVDASLEKSKNAGKHFYSNFNNE